MGCESLRYTAQEKRAYFARLKAYQTIPDDQLLEMEWITLKDGIQQIIGSNRQRAYCTHCGEEILNGCEITEDGLTTCIPCAGQAYYHQMDSSIAGALCTPILVTGDKETDLQKPWK